jgi:hypothetical protein
MPAHVAIARLRHRRNPTSESVMVVLPQICDDRSLDCAGGERHDQLVRFC